MFKGSDTHPPPGTLGHGLNSRDPLDYLCLFTFINNVSHSSKSIIKYMVAFIGKVYPYKTDNIVKIKKKKIPGA